VYQILRESDKLFPFYGNFHALKKTRKNKKKRRKNEETKAIPIGNYVSGQPPASYFGECKISEIATWGKCPHQILK